MDPNKLLHEAATTWYRNVGEYIWSMAFLSRFYIVDVRLCLAPWPKGWYPTGFL